MMHSSPPTDQKNLQLPFFSHAVPAGFPSPADDHLQQRLDLNEYLIKHPASTFYVRVKGHSMIDAGIQDGDLLIVDRSIPPAHKQVVLAVVGGEFTVKRLIKTANEVMLVAENPDYPPLCFTNQDELHIWGVVVHVIHSFL